MSDGVLFVSTRGGRGVDGLTAVLNGVPDDGGLFVPESFPPLKPSELGELNYAERAVRAVKRFLDVDMRGYVCDGEQAAVVKLDGNLFMLELWHDRTFSYADIAVSLLSHILRGKARERDAIGAVAVCCENDMARAAAHALGQSAKVTLCGAEEGDDPAVFAQARAAIRAVCADGSLKAALTANNLCLTAADSVNIGCVIPLIAHFYSAYCDLQGSGEIRAGDRIDYIVPAYSPSNLVAGLYAKRMGLPVNKLVYACGDCAFSEFIETGIFDVTGEGKATGDLCYLERILCLYCGPDECAALMAKLRDEGRFSVTPEEIERIRGDIACDGAEFDDADGAICDLFDEYGYIADGATASAYAVALRRECVRATVVLSLSHPYLQPQKLLAALGESARGGTRDMLAALEDITALDAPSDLCQLLTAQSCGEPVGPSDLADYIGSNILK